MKTRQPAVAGSFYPGSSDALIEEVDRCIPEGQQPAAALAVVLPHAGYVYSGRTAGEVLARTEVPDRVVLLGPKHHLGGARAAASTVEAWSMPFGDVPLDRELIDRITGSTEVELDDLAHRDEHSLEVEVPFLWRRNPDLKLTPIALGMHRAEELIELGQGIASVIAALDQPVLIAASTDMSHQIPQAEAERLDKLAIDKILALDPAGLHETVLGNEISMCGVMPTTAALAAAIALGAKTAELVEYTTSARASGDTARVVGYAGIIVR
ncbi:MAG: AmmeMemoRadiSam system protein B [Deltaproteobacteria bacterium]|nr:AmmeMemoRadiSam system protein B [Deltaproteobacteria bacterium]